MAKPDYVRDELVKALPVYELVAACYKGERAVKGRQSYTVQGVNNGSGGSNQIALSPYLPNPSPHNEDADVSRRRYDDYITRAVFYNVTKRTIKAMAGAVFSKYPTMTLNELQVLETDVDGGGQSLTQQAKDALTNCLMQGRGGLLADMPVNTDGVSKAAMAKMQVRPVIIHYDSASIINWRYRKVGGILKNSLVVLSESYVSEDDGYEQKTARQMLVLRLNDANLAESEILRKDDKGNWQSLGVNAITDHSGKQLEDLPFYPYGSVNNDLELDDVPIYDIAELNIAHLRNSADLEEMLFVSGQPTLVVSGLTEQWVSEVLENGIAIGSRSGILLPQGGSAQMLQAAPNSALFEAMQEKKVMMQSLGAKLIETSKVGQSKTATEEAQDGAEETSVLSTVAHNVSDAYTKALKCCARYMGYDDKALVVTLNTQFNFSKMTPAQLQQLMAIWQAGAISFDEMREALIEDEIAIEENHDTARQIIASEQGALFDNERANDGE